MGKSLMFCPSAQRVQDKLRPEPGARTVCQGLVSGIGGAYDGRPLSGCQPGPVACRRRR